ncbi:sulfotransferase family protein [Sphingomonas sp.]|uniref:sulfotransferase family protein n=1 Tax=Sphingomonas sp. TaxID=28214 RepID=UPI003B3A88D0
MTDLGYFFVCGAAKSGTTWLQRVLDYHPEVQSSGEGHFIERFSVPLAQLLRDYAKHMGVVSRLVYEGTPFYPPVAQADLDRLVRSFILDRLKTRPLKPGVRWIGDKTPRYTHGLQALLRLFPHMRIINIVRDPRDVAIARMHHARRSGVSEQVAEGTRERLSFIGAGGHAWASPAIGRAARAGGAGGIGKILRRPDARQRLCLSDQAEPFCFRAARTCPMVRRWHRH